MKYKYFEASYLYNCTQIYRMQFQKSKNISTLKNDC